MPESADVSPVPESADASPVPESADVSPVPESEVARPAARIGGRRIRNKMRGGFSWSKLNPVTATETGLKDANDLTSGDTKDMQAP